jgi:hypothetical protein
MKDELLVLDRVIDERHLRPGSIRLPDDDAQAVDELVQALLGAPFRSAGDNDADAGSTPPPARSSGMDSAGSAGPIRPFVRRDARKVVTSSNRIQCDRARMHNVA